jgi:membrane protein
MAKKGFRNFISEFIDEFNSNKVPKMAAALGYYTIFSLPAMLVIIIWVSDIFYGHAEVETKAFEGLKGLVGNDGAQQVQDTIHNASLTSGGNFATIVGIFTLIFGATGIFGEIQDSINQIWHLRSKPKKGRGFLKLVINRLLSFSIVGVLGFMLLASLIVNSVMDIFLQKLSARYPNTEVFVLYAFNFVFTFVIVAILFAVIFKVLPDARIKWKDIRPGVIVTTLLFMGGKFLISYYLGRSRISTTYGAAGSVIIILLWFYYSAIILYIGAVFTRLYALHRGSSIFPNNYAVRVEKMEVETTRPDHL